MPAESPLRDGDLAGLELIETLRWEPQGGFVRLDRHLARLAASAAELGFAYDAGRAKSALGDAVAEASGPRRVRLVLSHDGSAQVTTQPFAPIPAGKVWTLRLARRRLDSTDPLLRHKTSRREAYAQARAEYSSQEADEVLLANERGELCEGTITNVFADFGDGILVTPRLACGLLPGVLRAELLDDGQAREAVFGFDDLKTAKAIFVGNSLRGVIRARLVEEAID